MEADECSCYKVSSKRLAAIPLRSDNGNAPERGTTQSFRPNASGISPAPW